MLLCSGSNVLRDRHWFISLQTILFVWYTWRIGYGTAVYSDMFWLIVGTIVNIMCWYMLFRDLYFYWDNKVSAFMISLLVFCWYCWRIPNDMGPTILITIIYEFIDISTWIISGINMILILKGVFPKTDIGQLIKA